MDHYATLGISKNASAEEIKKAYRKLASRHHPDKGGDKAKFQQIQEAYSILSDPEKKEQYDNPMPQGSPFGFTMNMGENGVNINDLFSHIFNQPNMHRPSRQYFRTSISLSLRDAYEGGTKVVELNTQTGKKVIQVNIPKGVNSGDQVRYEKVIDQASLIIEFQVMPDLRFERRNADLYCNQSISVLDLIAGTDIEFTTISGKKLNVHIKSKTQPFMNIKIAGHGMPIPNTDRFGDQYLLLKPFIPDNIDNEIIDTILRKRA